MAVESNGSIGDSEALDGFGAAAAEDDETDGVEKQQSQRSHTRNQASDDRLA
jgi:hypothetical protein